jgi:dolichol kinase
MVPIGGALARTYPADQFAGGFALIWGSYIVTDTLAEIGGSLYGRQTLRVWGIGDVNRKSIGGTVTGLVGCLVFCLWLIWSHNLPPIWLGLAAAITVSNTVVELFAPRGTDDFFMATTNAIVCLVFGLAVLG